MASRPVAREPSKPARLPPLRRERTVVSDPPVATRRSVARPPSALTAAPATDRPAGPALASDSPASAEARRPPAEVLSRKPAFLQPPAPPRYPSQARRRNQQGVVLVEVRLDSRGEQRERKVVRSSGVESLDHAALDAVGRWRFLPETVAGQPVPSRVRIPVEFALTASR